MPAKEHQARLSNCSLAESIRFRYWTQFVRGSTGQQRTRDCMQNFANRSSASNRKHYSACRAELGGHPLIIKITKRVFTFHNYLKESDPDTLHNKALTHRETVERCSLRQLVLGLSPQTQAQPPNTNPIRRNQIIRKQKENYLTHWKDSTKRRKPQSKLECYLALNREYTHSVEYLSTVTDPKQRKSLATVYAQTQQAQPCNWVYKATTGRPGSHEKTDVAYTHCTQNEMETELHFFLTVPTIAMVLTKPTSETHTSHWLQTNTPK